MARTIRGVRARRFARERGGLSLETSQFKTAIDALGALPRDQAEVLVLRHVIGLSAAQTAQRMGLTENAVYGLHHDARMALRAELHHRP